MLTSKRTLTGKSSKPILITGSHRCGSTWLAAMLGAARNTTVLQEPFNIEKHFYRFNEQARYWFTYAPDLDQTEAHLAFEKVLRHQVGKVYERREWPRYLPWLRHGRQIIKDPIAAFSADWLSREFDLDVIMLVRHPAAFASSLKRLSWFFPFEHLRAQTRLMDEVLAPFRREIESPPEGIVEQAALLWVLIYHALHVFSQQHPEWIVRTHEQLSLDPMTAVHDLFDRLGLPWDDNVRAKIATMSDGDNPVDPAKGVVHSMQRNSRENIRRWAKVLTPEEIAHCKAVTQPIASLWYPDETWDIEGGTSFTEPSP